MTFSQLSQDKDQIGHCQPRVIIYIDFVILESPIVHSNFQDHGTSGSADFLNVGHISAEQQSWSYDLGHL